MAKKADYKHLLVIRLSAMGDVTMTVPAILALKEKYPNTKITILTKPHVSEVFSSIDGVAVFKAEVKKRHKGFFGLWRLYRELKPESITHVADLHNVLRSKILGFFFSMSTIPVKRIDKGRADKKALTHAKNKKFKPLKTTFERYQEVFGDLGFEFDLSQPRFLPTEDIDNTFNSPLRGDLKKLIGIAPFAAYPSKMYSLNLMEQVIQQLILKPEIKIFLFGGGKQEAKQLNVLESKFGENVKSMVGKQSFAQELALISNLDVMLAMDSGNGHLAANYGVPVVTIWGVTHPYAGFAPYKQPVKNSLMPDRGDFPLIPTSVYGNKYPTNYIDAINSISPGRIVETILGVLSEENPLV